VTRLASRYGPWALVTGSAMGIGAAFASRLAVEGFNLALVDRDPELLNAQADALGQRVEVRAVVADLSVEAEVERALDDVADLEIGLLIANAAHAATARWVNVPLEEKLKQIRVNCVAVTQMADRMSRAMVERRRGGIIMMSSLAGTIGSPMVATYAATKAFALILGESLWSELRRDGVDVLAVLPGMTRTPGFEGSLTPGAKLPRGARVMAPEDVVNAALGSLGRRPRVVVGGRNTFASAILQRLLPRKTAIGVMASSTGGLYRQD
jgi:uncharacterized protein